MNTNNSRKQRPNIILVASILLGLQLIGAIVILFWYFQHTFAGEFFDLPSTLFQILLALALVAWIGFALVGVYLGKTIARALAAVMQILLVALGVSFLQSGSEGILTVVAVAMIILAVAVLICLFTKAATEWLTEKPELQ